MMTENKIVIIDDESHIRMLLEQTLEDYEDAGVEIFSADNGQAGLDLIIKERPKLVFCDVMMPVMNGYEVCQQVKQVHQLNDVYLILLTAKGQEADKKKGESFGADLYMTKPFDPDLVFEKAGEILGVRL